MKLLNKDKNQEFEAEVIEVEAEDYKLIKNSKQFEFDWEKEKGNHVFKIIEKNKLENQEILGLLSLSNFSDEFRIHINLIENSSDNKGRDKKIDNVAGCLLAFAVRVSFEYGYQGFVSLVPKTELLEFYVNKYGFSQFGRQLAIEKGDAINLIQKYL